MAALACMSFVVLHFELSRRQEQAAAEGGVPASASAEGEKLASLLRPAAGDPALSTTPPPLAEQRYADPTPSILQQGISNSAVTHTNSLLSSAVAALKQHPLFNLDQSVKLPLEDVLQRISDDAACRANNTPIFITMANVKSHLYWQLIENFMYTMTKYGIASCALMICVSDARCLELCSQSNFPCYDYQYRESFPDRDMSKISPMEQIATLKLFHFPKALLKGVDVFVVDLDVGFLDDPMKFITSATNFYGHGGNTNNSSTFSGSGDDFSRLSALPDVFVQRDTTFIMNRTVQGWRTWWTEPMPNIGLMLVRGNKKTAKMFEQAWRMYLSISKDIKMNPGKDQNKVVQAMIAARWSVGLNWKYFPGSSAVLVDKIYKFENKSIELGGEHTSRWVPASLSHTNTRTRRLLTLGIFGICFTCWRVCCQDAKEEGRHSGARDLLRAAVEGASACCALRSMQYIYIYMYTYTHTMRFTNTTRPYAARGAQGRQRLLESCVLLQQQAHAEQAATLLLASGAAERAALPGLPGQSNWPLAGGAQSSGPAALCARGACRRSARARAVAGIQGLPREVICCFAAIRQPICLPASL